MAPVDDLQQELSAIRVLAIQYMLNAIADADMSGPSQAARSLTQAFADIVKAFGEQSAMAAARYLEIDRQVAGATHLPSVVPADTVPMEQIERSLNWALRPLDDGDIRRAEQQMAGTLQRLVDEPHRETIFAATVEAGTGFARVPGGPDPCAFCLMLASRGAVYQTELTATATTGRSTARSGRPDTMRYHDHCFCKAVEIRDDNEDSLPDVNRRAEEAWQQYLHSIGGFGGTLAGWTAYLKENPFTATPPDGDTASLG